MSSNVFSKWKKNDEFIMKISTYILILVFSAIIEEYQTQELF